MFNLIPLLFCFVFLLRLFNIQISYCNYFHAQRQLKNQYAYLFVGYSLDHKFDKELTMLPLNNSKTIQLTHGIHSLVLSLHESNDPNLISFMSGVSHWDVITIYVHILYSIFQKKSQVYQTYINLFIVVKLVKENMMVIYI
jgi:hypothetical protein